MRKDFKQLSLIKELLIGFCLGTANIIPGVSGGTFLLVFNIYERIFAILDTINKANILEFSKCITRIIFKTRKIESVKNLIDFLKKNDFIFLFKLIMGAVTAILCLSSLMKYLIVYHFSVTYALFFGLILVSIVIPVKMLIDKKFYLVFFIILGVVSIIYVTVAVNPYEKVKMKSEYYESQYIQNKEVNQNTSDIKTFFFTGKYTLDEYIYASVCGAIAVSAMVLPGISGSFVLILMGEYFEVISAISGLKVFNVDNAAFLGCFAIGIVLGGLLFSKLINLVLKRYYNATMAFLIGLMTGSLYTLWPFKKSIIMAQQYFKQDGVIGIAQNVRIYTNINEIPQMGAQFYISLVSFTIGCTIMCFFVWKELGK